MSTCRLNIDPGIDAGLPDTLRDAGIPSQSDAKTWIDRSGSTAHPIESHDASFVLRIGCCR